MLKKFHLKHDEAEEDWLGMYGAAQVEIQQEAAAKNDDADPLAAARRKHKKVAQKKSREELLLIQMRSRFSDMISMTQATENTLLEKT